MDREQKLLMQTKEKEKIEAMKITGWTEWDDPKYEELFPDNNLSPYMALKAAEQMIADEIRKKGYKFSGIYHQGGEYGVPVFDNKYVYQCSQRTWGGIMALAYPEECESDVRPSYVRWAWLAPEEMVVPNG